MPIFSGISGRQSFVEPNPHVKHKKPDLPGTLRNRKLYFRRWKKSEAKTHLQKTCVPTLEKSREYLKLNREAKMRDQCQLYKTTLCRLFSYLWYCTQNLTNGASTLNIIYNERCCSRLGKMTDQICYSQS